MSLVLDPSVTIAWVHQEENTDAIQAVFEAMITRGAWVPDLWKLEVANILEMGVRRKRHDAGFRNATLADLQEFPITVDPYTSDKAWSDTALFAAKYGLTLYDAAYLELALRRALPLATLDLELRAAARQAGVPLLGL